MANRREDGLYRKAPRLTDFFIFFLNFRSGVYEYYRRSPFLLRISQYNANSSLRTDEPRSSLRVQIGITPVLPWFGET